MQAPEKPCLSAYSPAAQAVQLRSEMPIWLVPGMQAVQAAAPDASLVSRPLGHRVQVLAAYMEGRKRRAPHLVQLLAPVPSAAAPPVASVIWPDGQALHAFWPWLAAK